MSCSFNWICTSSSRLGCPSTRPFRVLAIHFQPVGAGACAVASRAARMVGLFLLLLANFDHVVWFHRERGDIDLAAVHLDVAVADQLAGLARGWLPKPMR